MDVSQSDIVLKNITSQAKAVDIAAINLCCSKAGRFPPCDRARGGLYYPGNTAAIPIVLDYCPWSQITNMNTAAVQTQLMLVNPRIFLGTGAPCMMPNGMHLSLVSADSWSISSH